LFAGWWGAGRRGWVLAAGLLLAAIIAIPVGSRVWLWYELKQVRRDLHRGEPRLAINRLVRIHPAWGGAAECDYLTAVALRRSGRLDDVEEYLSRSARGGWAAQDIDRQRLLLAGQIRGVKAVEPLVLQLVQEDNSDEAAEEIYEALCQGYLASYRLHDAWMWLGHWLEWQPRAVQPHLLRADICERVGDPTGAADDYRLVLAVAPKHPLALLKLGRLLLGENRVAEALELFSKRRAVLADEPDSLLGIAECQRRLADAVSARRTLERLGELKLTAEQKAALSSETGHLALMDSRYGEAVSAFEDVVAAMPYDSSAQHSLALALNLAGDSQRAREHEVRSRQIRQDYERLCEIRKQLVDDPESADLRCEAGEILLTQGLAREGAGWLLTALEYDPRHPQAHAAMARYYILQGDRDSAARHQLLAGAVNPSDAPNQEEQ
jgi:Tfp pilus assembly protein PilF